MEYIFSHSIKLFIDTYFPYPALQRNYSEDEYKRYDALANRIAMPLGVFMLISFWAIWLSSIFWLDTLFRYLGTIFYPGCLYIKSIALFTVICSCLLAVGISFPAISIILLRVVYPFSYKQLIDFISRFYKIDLLKMSKKAGLILVTATTLLIIYDAFNCLLVRKNDIYIKEWYAMPTVVNYRNINYLIYQRTQRIANNADTSKESSYIVACMNGTRLQLPKCTQIDSAASIILARSGTRIVYYP